jgi:hypothetical protein
MTRRAPAALGQRDLNRATLARQMLLSRDKVAALDAVERLVAMQAQLAKPPFVGLWTRVAGFAREDLRKLLAAKRVVRATSLRATLHLMSARDYARMRAALQPMLTAGMTALMKARKATLELDKVIAEARAFLAGGPADFDAIRKHLVTVFPRANDRVLGFAVRMQLPLVQVPSDDAWSFPGAATFTPADSWLGKPLGTDTAPHELVHRYLGAFGPATVADAQTWSGMSGLQKTFDDMRDELVVVRDERGRELFDLAKAPRPGGDAAAPVRFLPDFDNLVLGHADRSRLIDDAHRSKVTTKNLQVRATVLVDGRVAGTWKVERKKAATVVVESFAAIAKRVRGELEEEGEALARFVEPDAASFAVVIR